jgi:exo-beta-1,3-glucanase (GH17 family)
MRIVLAVIFSLVATAALAAEPCSPRPAVAPALARLESAMAHDRFVTYAPTALTVIDGVVTPASEESVRADLKALRPYFDGIITYSARDGAEFVPQIAQELGFKAVIIGLWSPADQEELRNALTATKKYPKLVVGLSLGNEIVFGQRGTWDNLKTYIDLTRQRVPGVPLTVTEPFAQFLDGDAGDVRDDMDFMLVNIHPIFEKWFATAGPDNWADFVVKVTGKLSDDFCGPIIVKETGTPTGPASMGYDEAKQAAFWRALEKQMTPSAASTFSYFSAFDAPWRANDITPGVPGQHPEEAFWGLFTQSRQPKPAIADLKTLAK